MKFYLQRFCILRKGVVARSHYVAIRWLTVSHKILGSCHCGNVSYEIATEVKASDLTARSCDCSFCRMHSATTWSDPQGSATIRIKDPASLQKYQFSLRTAEFFICRVCEAYIGAVLIEGDTMWSTLNLGLSDLALKAKPVSYGSEDASNRISRRRGAWTPTTVVGTTNPVQATDT